MVGSPLCLFMLKINQLNNGRAGVTSSILGAMKAIKISSLTKDVLALLNNLRRDELAAASKFRFISVITATIGELRFIANQRR